MGASVETSCWFKQYNMTLFSHGVQFICLQNPQIKLLSLLLNKFSENESWELEIQLNSHLTFTHKQCIPGSILFIYFY